LTEAVDELKVQIEKLDQKIDDLSSALKEALLKIVKMIKDQNESIAKLSEEIKSVKNGQVK
jgi:predicted  nucleic acid-binding Zn-ribbon protein